MEGSRLKDDQNTWSRNTIKRSTASTPYLITINQDTIPIVDIYATTDSRSSTPGPSSCSTDGSYVTAVEYHRDYRSITSSIHTHCILPRLTFILGILPRLTVAPRILPHGTFIPRILPLPSTHITWRYGCAGKIRTPRLMSGVTYTVKSILLDIDNPPRVEHHIIHDQIHRRSHPSVSPSDPPRILHHRLSTELPSRTTISSTDARQNKDCHGRDGEGCWTHGVKTIRPGRYQAHGSMPASSTSLHYPRRADSRRVIYILHHYTTLAEPIHAGVIYILHHCTTLAEPIHAGVVYILHRYTTLAEPIHTGVVYILHHYTTLAEPIHTGVVYILHHYTTLAEPI
ncbi:hypothetical protein HD553DRAFT_321021 [Filobasidium floriforme]|uniref:uncharacterized protein n=1 Tax=Filobasidium floriforme TaxID=5210 RepID=UPI001E8E982D|nr:uncharacterized protein HD553DRAFT_321021 [Filobasidium floriforme]KAH8090291.1 hypothetical protein HD553DRAFT_321021 [Filobasidium floriforme]